MLPAPRKPVFRLALLGVLLLAGCGAGDKPQRPPEKPNYLVARVGSAGQSAKAGELKLARVSTKSGEILILEPDGEVTSMDLDSPEGKEAFAITEADLMALNANLDIDLSGVAGPAEPGRPPRKSAQQKMIEAFAARTQPLLPNMREGAKIDPEDFLAVQVVVLNPGKGDDLVSVKANLRKGVDADIAFSYATCALAGWANDSGANYGRHIRTLQDTRNGKVLINAAFTISDEKPLGLRVMETQDALQECKARGIPAA
ncbi:hypothetical protein [Paracoccus onubensis]|uniref:Lipoprotein n=1 Tax=Paracoccus onubensis TaxID=1675788 RepID=A0A418SWE9_9RHOB|nr:hypothetical protein [Paracoccus onubensis]RJE85279.1 hypothetical protein D3P04_09665 [Paracoccus onubensis]